MQPICPSGEERGETVQTEGHGSGAGAAEGEPRPKPFARSHAKGLVLTGDGPSGPNDREGCQPFAAGDERARDRRRMAETDLSGSVHESPARMGAHR